MKPICVPCRRFFRMRKSGFYFVEGMPIGEGSGENGRVLPGTAEPGKWKPYKLWVGDRWECEGCGTIILSGFGAGPISEHYEKDFDQMVERTGASQFQVNDC